MEPGTVVSFLNGVWDGQGAQTLVHDHKMQRDAWLNETPNDVFICDAQGHSTELPTAFEIKAVESYERSSGRNVYGLGASPGQASGRTRVIRHPNEGQSLQAGEILVAPSTDPGWTPLFLRASAIVMETGGYLSHGAIVARELGIPAVINIPGLLQTIQDGQLLTVDGDKGHIILGEMCEL